MRDTMSIIGIYSYDPTIFDSVSALSATVTDADGAEHTATIAADKIVDNILCDCAELEILYTQPDYLKFAIGNWWGRKSPIYTALLETTLYKYDAIANYDRREEWTDTNEATANANDSVAAFNASSMVPRAESGSKTSGTGKHAGRVYGNIGVTTTQTLLEQERYVALYNAYRAIAEDFQARFCLLVY